MVRPGARFFARLIVLPLCVALVGAACSKDDKAKTEPTSVNKAADCKSPGISASEVRVGVLSPQSGDEAGDQFRPFALGVVARFKAENEEKGGIDGRGLTAEVGDDGNDVARNKTVAKELVEQKKVFGLIEASPRAPGSATYLHKEGIPVTGWPIHPVWGKYDNFFGYGGSTAPDPERVGGATNGTFLYEHGARKLAALGFANSEESAAATRGLMKSFVKLGGSKAYLTTDVPFGSTDFTADVQRIKDSGADSLSGLITAPSFISLYGAARQAGLDFKVALSPTGYDQRLLTYVGKQMAGVYFLIDWRPFEMEVPEHARFKDWLGKVAPDEAPGQLAMAGWLSAGLFIKGLHSAGVECPTRDAFIANLRATDDWDGNGLLPKPVDQEKSFGKPQPCQYFLRVSDDGSRFEPLDGWTPFCGTKP